MLKIEAGAKINWALNITGRRADGYHELDMLMQSISLCDTVELYEAEDISLEAHNCPQGAENIALRAALLLRERLGVRRGARIQIEKRIPMGAGLGGGSADAAAVLAGLNRLWGLGLTEGQLASLGLELGADVPFFFTGGLARARGVGEVLAALPAPDLHIVIAHPGPGLSTPQVYARYDAAPGGDGAHMASIIESLLKNELPTGLYNALEAPASDLLPRVRELKQSFTDAGARCCAMTGSGSAVFAAFSSEAEAHKTARAIDAPFVCAAHTTKKALKFS